jgi:hypothetical protein
MATRTFSLGDGLLVFGSVAGSAFAIVVEKAFRPVTFPAFGLYLEVLSR